MKRLKSMVLIPGIVAMIYLTSCSSDDSGGGDALNVITFDGTAYTMVAGLVEDYGSGEPINDLGDATHYNFDFTIIDDEIVTITTPDETYLGAGPDATIGIYIELFSPGTSGFQAGTFNFVEYDGVTQSDIAGEYFFFGGEVELDSDGTENGDFDGDEFEITGGSVTVVGSGTTEWTITYNLQVSGGRTVVGTYTGPFTYSDNRD